MAKSPKNHKIIPAVGELLVEELEPDYEKQLSTGSSLELAGGSIHDQLRIARVLANGGPDLVSRMRAASLQKAAPNDLFQHKLPQAIKAGDLVAFQSLSAHKLRVSGKQYLLVEYEHVKATLQEAK